MTKKLKFSIFFTLASLLSVLMLVGCGKHSFEDIFDSDIDGFSSSSNVEELGSSSSGNGTVPGVVGPLLKTRWGQGVPFNNLLPVDNNGVRAITGCSVISLAMLMKYHNHPIRGTGQSEPYTMSNGIHVPSVDFNVDYDWDNMLNIYTANATEQQRDAVATLVYHVGSARGRDYFTGRHINSWPVVLTNFFGYDKSIRQLQRIYYDDAAWEAIIREQLDAGLPVHKRGNNQPNTSDHEFIIDGYDSEGRFHINWGWNGRDDGWFFLNELNPGNHCFNYGNAIIINIKPDQGGVSAGYEMGLLHFTSSENTVSQNERFTVSVRIRNVSSLDGFSGGQIGIALVNSSGNIVDVIGSANIGLLNANTGFVNPSNINCFVPETVATGQYSLRAVIRTTGGEWKIITKSAVGNDVPNGIEFTVTPEESVTPGGGYGQTLLVFTADKHMAVHSETTQFTTTLQMRNATSETFTGGQYAVALLDSAGKIVSILGIGSSGGLSPGYRHSSTRDINCTVPPTVPSGQYKLRILVRPGGGDWRIATLSDMGIPNSIEFTVE
jgi:hypothetical protein